MKQDFKESGKNRIWKVMAGEKGSNEKNKATAREKEN